MQGRGSVMATFNRGDVFVAVEDGKVQWRDKNGVLVATLDTGRPGTFTTGMAFDSLNRLYVTNFSDQSVQVFDSSGNLLGNFGSGYDADPESILFDANVNAYVGQANGTGDILKFDAAGNPLTAFDVAREARGSDWIDLDSDQCTMFYTSEGFLVKRFDVCNNTQLPDFATLPNSPAFALRILPDGGVLVADSAEIVRLNAAGAVIQTYDAPGEDNWFALNLDPDGTSFWSADFSTANVYKFDIASGNILLSFNTGTGADTVFGLAINGEITAANICPIVNSQSCCQVIVEQKTQLVPPAQRGSVTHEKTVEASVEKVCPEKVVICGLVRKIITYLDAENQSQTRYDDIPFLCFIDRDDANENDEFHVTGATILCTIFAREANFGGPNNSLAYKFIEKEIVKVCIRKGPAPNNS